MSVGRGRGRLTRWRVASPHARLPGTAQAAHREELTSAQRHAPLVRVGGARLRQVRLPARAQDAHPDELTSARHGAAQVPVGGTPLRQVPLPATAQAAHRDELTSGPRSAAQVPVGGARLRRVRLPATAQHAPLALVGGTPVQPLRRHTAPRGPFAHGVSPTPLRLALQRCA